MKQFVIFLVSCVSICFLTSMDSRTNSTNLKCLIQMKNYEGHGAYIVVSRLNEQLEYIETHQILGDDPEWYHEVESWWSFFGKEKRSIDGITGATLSGGQRRVIQLNFSDYSPTDVLRFETAVEEQPYYVSEIDITISDLNGHDKYEGQGYIRYLRFVMQ